MPFSLNHPLIVMTLISVIVVGVEYSIRIFDGLTILVVVGTMLVHIVLPTGGDRINIWNLAIEASTGDRQ